MPFHIFLAQWVSLYTGGLEVWKVAKDVILGAAALFTFCLVFATGRATKGFKAIAYFSMLYGLLHLFLWALHPNIYRLSAEIGIIYNVRLPLYLLLGYGAILLWPKFVFSSLIKPILIIGTIVASLGLIQYFLPSDLLTHFGYAISRGTFPVFFVDGNPTLPVRIMSTLREPNALGAFLIIPTSLAFLLMLRNRTSPKGLIFFLCVLLNCSALLLTLSRSAWLGLMISFAVILCIVYQRYIRQYWVFLACTASILALLTFALAYSLRNTTHFQSYVSHAGQSQPDDPNSDGYHRIFLIRGLKGIANNPLGHGPGTAGLASIQNPQGSFLTENYYVQLGYELGLLGVAMFVALQVWLYRRLQIGVHNHNEIALVLCASFWAYFLINMLLHSWENEAVAAQWWLLTGFVVAQTESIKKHVL